MATHYTAYDKAADYGTNAQEGYPMQARTDKAAREEGKKIAEEKGFIDLGISFFRDSDHCKGEIHS